VFTAAWADEPHQATVASTSDVQHAFNGRRPDPAATPASLAPMVTTLDFIPALPDSGGPFPSDDRSPESGGRIRLARITRHPDWEFLYANRAPEHSFHDRKVRRVGTELEKMDFFWG